MSQENRDLTPCAQKQNPCGELPKNPIVSTKNPAGIVDRQAAIALLAKFKNTLPKATTLVDMKTNNVFAEPGT